MDQQSEPTATATTPNTTTTTATSVEWSNIPDDILLNLLKHIDLTLDLPRIRGVCSNWRTSLPIPKLPSHFKVPDLDDDESKDSLLLIESRFYLISPLGDPTTTPWLARITETGPNKWHLLDPFNIEDYFHSVPSITTGINLLDSVILELAKPWSLVGPSGKTMSKKVVGGWNFNSSYIFAVLVQIKTPFGNGEGGLVFKKLYDQEWVSIEGTFPDDDENKPYRILDIAYHNGLFYAFELVNWKVGVIDPSDTQISFKFMDAPDCRGETIDNSFSVSIDGDSYILGDVYLVPCNDQLYLIISSHKVGSEKATFFVFVLKQGEKIEENKWERVMSLGNQILFIGYDVSFGVSSTILPNWKPGSICLFIRPFPLIYDSCSSDFQGLPEGGECLEMISYPEYWRYLDMYNMEEEEKGIVGFEELSIKDYTGLFFPPPAWVKWHCPTLDNVDIRLHNLKFSGISDSRKFKFGEISKWS